MKFDKTAVFLLSSSAFALSTDDIETKVGDGCANSVSFTSSFVTDAGLPCTSCGFCSGSAIRDLFNPKKLSTCVECDVKESSCNKLRVVTAFDKAWKMPFFSLLSSDAPSSDDPTGIVLEGSNTHDGGWKVLYDSSTLVSGLEFSARKAEELFILNANSDNEFKYFAITFVRKKDNTKIQIGNYGIIQSYTKVCTSNLHEALTETMVPPYTTSAPTSAPTKTPYIFNTITLQGAAHEWCANDVAAETKYGHISNWDVSRVTRMYYTFGECKSFNDDISRWDVSRVTSFDRTFVGAQAFNRDISSWNMSKATDLIFMFTRAKNFNQDISSWDVSNVWRMGYMFHQMNFNQDISAWNVSKLTDAKWMFYGSPAFKQKLCWKLPSNCNTNGMFHNTGGSIDC